MHPRAEPKQPRCNGGNADDDIGNFGIIFRDASGDPCGKDQSEEDGAENEIEEGAGGEGGGYGHGGLYLLLFVTTY
jgi:hypothetical protein